MSLERKIKALETGSGISWKDWLEFLRPHQKLSHTDMARLALGEIIRVGQSNSPEWWAQSVTIAYELHIGRRQPGQQSSGTFSVTVSKTILAERDNALAMWIDAVGPRKAFDGIQIVGNPRISGTEKWSYWRCDLEDNSKISVNITDKNTPDKSSLSINHDNLKSAEDVEKWRSFWKNFSV